MALKSNALAQNQITTNELIDNSVSTNKFLNSTVGNSDLQNSNFNFSTTSGMFLPSSVNLGDVASISTNVDGSSMLNSSGTLRVGTIVNSQIADNTLNAQFEFAANSISMDKILGYRAIAANDSTSGRIHGTSVLSGTYPGDGTNFTTIATVPVYSLGFRPWVFLITSNGSGSLGFSGTAGKHKIEYHWYEASELFNFGSYFFINMYTIPPIDSFVFQPCNFFSFYNGSQHGVGNFNFQLRIKTPAGVSAKFNDCRIRIWQWFL